MNKIKEKLYERRVFLIILTLFWLYVIFVLQCMDVNGSWYTKRIYDGYDRFWSNAILTGDVLTQDYTASDNNLYYVGVTFGTFARVNSCSYKVTVTNIDDNIVCYDKTLNASSFDDGLEYKFRFESQKLSKGKTYRLAIQGIDSTQENSVCVLGISRNNSSEFAINGKPQGGTTCSLVGYTMSGKVHVLQIVLYMVIIILSYVCCILIDGPNEKSFLVIAMITGLFFIIINPMFHAIDELTHYFRSYAISEGYFVDQINEGYIGAEMPNNFDALSQLTIKNLVMNYDDLGQSYSSEKTFYTNPYMSSVLPTNHCVAAVGIFVARLFNAPIFVVAWMSRLIVLAVYIAMCYYAIKSAKCYKSLYFIVSLLPMSIWLASSCSQDPIVNGASILFVATCLKYKFDEHEYVTKKDMTIIILCGLAIVSVKYLVYSPLLLLFFFIPKDKFKGNARKIMIAIASFVVVLSLGGQMILLKKYPFKEDRNIDVDVVRQIKFMLGHIGYSIRNFAQYFTNYFLFHLKNFRYESATDFFAEVASFFGIAFAPMLCKDRCRVKEEKKTISLVMIFIFLVVTLLTMTALYVGYTTVGKYGIDGLQTRYFVPILLPCMYVMSKTNIENNMKKYDLFLANLMLIGLMDNLIGIMLKVF